ncbi:hypothetical protein FA95DRAFT_1602137 [Auriscalpium vulgare]|uniref:Uncharacterized protein n=1 Tax=Auriscalpium vulgare TaxID=40419 RepID=A0ACB8S8A9_9AGAM|nr:hypothetical protein FA95DRAFT_1602137 [Auriscalpium vulgare]
MSGYTEASNHNQPTGQPPPGGGSEYGDPAGKIWSVYLGVADHFDTALAESWKGDSDGILIFTGLFSASVSAFVIESYKGLQQDPGIVTTQLLAQISLQLAASANGSQTTVPPLSPSDIVFRSPASLVRVNVFWFLSLVLSVSCALGAVLIQQWARRYIRMTQRPAAPYRRARIRAYLYNGLVRFHLVQVVETIPVLLHASVFLFFAGLVQFLFTVNLTVAYLTMVCVALVTGAYVLVTIMPMLYVDAPLLTPLSSPLWKAVYLSLLPFVTSTAKLTLKLPFSPSFQLRIAAYAYTCKQNLSAGLTRGLWDNATRSSTIEDARALGWLARSIYEDSELGPLVEGISGFLKSNQMYFGTMTIWRLLREQYLGRRIATMLAISINGPVTPLHTQRALTTLNTVWDITDAFRRHHMQYSHIDPTRQLIFSLKLLRADPAPEVAVMAHCTAMLRVPGLLEECEHLPQPDPQKQAEVLSWLPQAVKDQCRTPEETLRDGLLVAVTNLCDAILPQVDVLPEGNLTAVWNTLKILVDPQLSRNEAPSADAERRFVTVLQAAASRRDSERFERATRHAHTPVLSAKPPYATIVDMLLPIADRLVDGTCIADVAQWMRSSPAPSLHAPSAQQTVISRAISSSPAPVPLPSG